MGFYMLIFLGGLQDIPRVLRSRAHRWRRPDPELLATSRCRCCGHQLFRADCLDRGAPSPAAQAFDLIYVMTKGGPANSTSLLIVYIYQQAFQYSAPSAMPSAMASLLVVLLLVDHAVLLRSSPRAGGSSMTAALLPLPSAEPDAARLPSAVVWLLVA